MTTIDQDKAVAIHYTLTNDAGEELDSSQGGQPLYYLHGHHNIVPGLESELQGKAVGDTFSVAVPPEEGYGVPSGQPPQPLERTDFPDDVEIVAGMAFLAQGPDQHPIQVFVQDTNETQIFITTDHPLAGVTLNFAGEVIEIRDASEEEIAHGHIHGPGGHHH